MFESREFPVAPTNGRIDRALPDPALPHPAPAPELTPAQESDRDAPMLGAIRAMLAHAVEAAFDLRGGQGESPHLGRFDDMVAQQTGRLDGLSRADFASDPALLTRRAGEALRGFAAAVREEIVDQVRPGIGRPAFDAALHRMTDRAIAAGVAFALLDIALARSPAGHTDATSCFETPLRGSSA